MSDGTKIEWTDATLFGEALPRRCATCRIVKPVADYNVDRSRPDGHGYVCRACQRMTPDDEPNGIERAAARERGEAWCRDCRSWLRLENVTKQGLCRDHQRASDRTRYAEDPAHRERRKAHATRHKRGVEPVPMIAKEYLIELFEGGCAYCDSIADTWDHVIPVVKGGRTEPSNIVPTCTPCNSSKRDHDLDEWLAKTGRQMSIVAIEHLSHHGGLDG